MKCVIRFGSIYICFDGAKYWLQQNDGEAMEVSEGEIEAILQRYYKGNF